MNHCKDCFLYRFQFGGWCSYEKRLWQPGNKSCNIFRKLEEWENYDKTPEEAIAEIIHEVVDIGESYILQDAARLLDIFFVNEYIRHNGLDVDKIAECRNKLYKEFYGEEIEVEK